MMSTDCRPLQMEPFLSARFSHKKYRGNKQKKAMSGFLVGGTAIDLVGVEVIFMNLLFASKLPFSNLYDRIVLIITAWDNEVTGTAFDTSMIPSTMDHGMPLLAQKKRCTHVTISCSCDICQGMQLSHAIPFIGPIGTKYTRNAPRDERPRDHSAWCNQMMNCELISYRRTSTLVSVKHGAFLTGQWERAEANLKTLPHHL